MASLLSLDIPDAKLIPLESGKERTLITCYYNNKMATDNIFRVSLGHSK